MADTEAGHGGMTLAEKVAAAAGIEPGSENDGLDGLDGPAEETAGTGDADGDDGEAQASSEEGLRFTEGGEEDDAPEGPAQTERRPADAPAPTVSRLIRNVRVKERELAAERQARRGDQAELARLRAEVEGIRRGAGDPDDPVDLVRSWAVRRLGLTAEQASDPRVLRALQEAATDLTAEAFEASDADPALRERRLARQRQREEAGRFRSYEQRIAAMEAERSRAQDEAVVAEVRADATQYLAANSARTPHLSLAVEAGDVDPVRLLMESAAEMIRSGEAPEPRSKADVGRLYGLVLANAERHYAGLAARLSSRTAGKPPGGIVGGNGDARGQRRGGESRSGARDGGDAGDGRRGPARTPARATRGGGGRGSATPEPPESNEPGERLTLEQRVRRAELAARRGR